MGCGIRRPFTKLNRNPPQPQSYLKFVVGSRHLLLVVLHIVLLHAYTLVTYTYIGYTVRVHDARQLNCDCFDKPCQNVKWWTICLSVSALQLKIMLCHVCTSYWKIIFKMWFRYENNKDCFYTKFQVYVGLLLEADKAYYLFLRVI